MGPKFFSGLVRKRRRGGMKKTTSIKASAQLLAIGNQHPSARDMFISLSPANTAHLTKPIPFLKTLGIR